MDRILIILKKENGPRASSAPALGLNTIIFEYVYWYVKQISGERLQDHWSSGLGLRLKLFDCYRLFPFLQAFGDAYQLVPPSQKAGEVIAPYMVYNTTGLDLTLKLDSAFEVCTTSLTTFCLLSSINCILNFIKF